MNISITQVVKDGKHNGWLLKTPAGTQEFQLPLWAKQLVRRVCEDNGIPQPPIRYSRSSQPYSQGRTTISRIWGYIYVSFGKDRTDQKMVLLHELAHWITLEGHTKRFWEVAWSLYRKYKADLKWALCRESGYKVTALKVAASKRIPGAKTKLAEHRKANRRRRQRARVRFEFQCDSCDKRYAPLLQQDGRTSQMSVSPVVVGITHVRGGHGFHTKDGGVLYAPWLWRDEIAPWNRKLWERYGQSPAA